jgi:hypothetical protein
VRQPAGRRSDPLRDAVARRPQHLEVDPELAPIDDLEPRVGRRIGVEHRGNVVLGMAGGKQHAGDRQDALRPLLAQPVEAAMDDRIGELEVAVFQRHAREPRAQAIGQPRKLVHGAAVAAAVTAQHHAGVRRQDR